MTDSGVSRCLAGIRERSLAIAGVVRRLSSEQWEGSTNCPPWRVSELATHILTSGQGFVRSIRRGLDGVVEPVSGAVHAVEGGPPEVAEALVRVTDEFEALYDGLLDAQLETICFHRRGNRSIRWYAAHRLAEVTFHGWDLDVSLGNPAAVDSAVALLLLPMLLESNVPRTYAAGLSAERGRGERFLVCLEGDRSAQWLVTIGPEALLVTRGDAPADLTITADAPTLALLVYGRADLASCGAKLDGDLGLVERFARIFPRP
ncbi:MAG TPA: maleylpyruvate isomerase family mycothiol-dependent enzyme [Chloroflexota bacterium]